MGWFKSKTPPPPKCPHPRIRFINSMKQEGMFGDQQVRLLFLCSTCAEQVMFNLGYGAVDVQRDVVVEFMQARGYTLTATNVFEKAADPALPVPLSAEERAMILLGLSHLPASSERYQLVQKIGSTQRAGSR